MRSSSRSRSVSVASALPTSCKRLELARPAGRGLVEARVLDRHRRLSGEERDELLVLVREVLAALLLGEVEVAVGDAAQQDRHAEEAAHRRMSRREADRARILREVVQPQRPRLADQHPEDAAPARQVADLRAQVVVDAVGDELLQLDPVRVDHAERGIASAGQLGRGLHEPVEQRVERQLRGDGESRREQRTQPPFGDRERVHEAKPTPQAAPAGKPQPRSERPPMPPARRATRLGEKRRREMKALVYHGPGQRAWEDVPDPTIQEPTDAIVRIDSSTICGTDLHILKGDVPEVKPGTILGHEAVGTVVEIGSAVTTLEPGDRVLVSCITSCGRCRFCKEGRYGLCTGGGGWIFGHLIDGLQAELARVPFADTSVYKVPDELTDEQVLFLADILPTAYEVGVLNGRVEPGDTVAIVGAGPIGLAAIMTAQLHSPGHIVAIDLDSSRLEKALEFGADVAIDNSKEDPVARVMELTAGLGADVAIEAVGVPETFELCTDLIRPGGRVANVGVHGHPATLHLEKLWIRDVLITTGLVDTTTTPKLLRLIEAGRLDPTPFATHRFALADAEEAYDVFGAAAESHALKVVLEAAPVGTELAELHEVPVTA